MVASRGEIPVKNLSVTRNVEDQIAVLVVLAGFVLRTSALELRQSQTVSTVAASL